MINLETFLKVVKFKIIGGDPYMWGCYGPNARSIDATDHGDTFSESGWSASIVFDTEDQTVYNAEIWDYDRKNIYRLINPDYREAHKKECQDRGVDDTEVDGGYKFVDLEVDEDFLEKITAIVNGESYDERVMIAVELSTTEFATIAMAAHKLNITFNEFVNRVLEDMIDREQRKAVL